MKFKSIKYIIVIPHGHNEIHHQNITEKLLDDFIKTGLLKFKITI